MKRIFLPCIAICLTLWLAADSAAPGQVSRGRYESSYDARHNHLTGRPIPARTQYNPYTGRNDQHRYHNHDLDRRSNVREKIQDRIEDRIEDRIRDREREQARNRARAHIAGHVRDRNYNSLTGQRYYDSPYRAPAVISGTVYNPYTGTYVRGTVRHNPLTGQPATIIHSQPIRR